MCPHGTEYTPVPVEKSNTTPLTCLPKITLKCFFQHLLYAICPEMEGEAWQLGRRVLGSQAYNREPWRFQEVKALG